MFIQRHAGNGPGHVRPGSGRPGMDRPDERVRMKVMRAYDSVEMAFFGLKRAMMSSGRNGGGGNGSGGIGGGGNGGGRPGGRNG